MASFTLSTAPWPVGTTVGAYLAQAWLNPPFRPSGPAVVTSTVTAGGTVAFTSLADQGRYVAWAANAGVRFTISPAGLQQPVAIPDRERITALEARAGTGTGGGTTPASAGVLLINAGDPLPDTSYPEGTLLVILGAP
jgi:hypothetical protein